MQKQSGVEYAILSSRMAQHLSRDFALAIIGFHEQVLGCHTYISRAKSLTELQRGYEMLHRLLSDYQLAAVLPFDDAATREYDQLLQQRIRIGTNDLRIGAIALANQLTLLTRNKRDFSKVPGLAIEDWTV